MFTEWYTANALLSSDTANTLLLSDTADTLLLSDTIDALLYLDFLDMIHVLGKGTQGCLVVWNLIGLTECSWKPWQTFKEIVL